MPCAPEKARGFGVNRIHNMKPTSEYTRDERSLLLYLESCAVDGGGNIDNQRMNDTDWTILKEWHGSGFVKTGRIAFKDLGSNKHRSQWVHLSEEAWVAAHQLRRDRAAVNSRETRSYKITQEKRNPQ